MNQSASQSFKRKLLALMVLRVVIALVFLGAATWFQLRNVSLTSQSYYPLHAIVVAVGLLTIAYAVALGRVRNQRFFAYVQVTIDVALVTLAVYITGGIASYLPVLYFISVMGSSMVLGRRGGYYAASLSSIAYGFLMELDFYKILPQKYMVFTPAVPPVWEDVVTTTATHILGFFTVAYLVGYLAEKTARMERQLEEKEVDFDRLESLNRLIVENIPTGIMTLDESGRITSFNSAASRITGYSLKDVYLGHVEDVFPDLLDEDSESVVSGVRTEKTVRKKDGKEICLGFTVSRGHRGDISSIVIFQDLTQLKAMEDQLRRDDRLKALGELSAAIAHEVRNPLASISGSIQLLSQDMELRGEKRHLMDIVLRETERLNSLITDFLLFAKPAPVDRAERIDVSEVIRETVKVFSNSPQAKGVDIEGRLEDGLFIDGDRRQISQVFWNLFLNAANAMPQGGRLTVASTLKDAPGGSVPNRTDGQGGYMESRRIQIEITDTGEGIEPDDLSKIFDPFFSTRESGTGMGLALVHRIIESHGGSVDVTSTRGEGATFRIMLPLSTAQPALNDGGGDRHKAASGFGG